MKLNQEEKKTLQIEFCERCAIISNPAVAFSECERERVFQNLLRSGFRPV